MQNLVIQLQNMIKKHYGLSSQLVLETANSHSEIYSQIDRTLSIPLVEPKTQEIVAFFKINDVVTADQGLIGRITDLVHVTLQSYINLIEKMEKTESLIQHLQMELHPEKIIRLQKDVKRITIGSIRLGGEPETEEEIHDEQDEHTSYKHQEILLLSKSAKLLDTLSTHLHDAAKNNFYIRTDHMPESFMTSINDLTGLERATLYIPRIQSLTLVQQKTLETYFLLQKHKPSSLLIIVGTHRTMQELVNEEHVSPSLLKNLHLFHLMADDVQNREVLKFETLSHCATAILGMELVHPAPVSESHKCLTKSYNVIPSLRDFSPTIH